LEIDQLIEEASDNAHKHGWVIRNGISNTFAVPEALMLCVTELSEAMEEWRDGRIQLYYDHEGKPKGFETEIADCLIRLFHLCGDLGIDIEKVLEIKMNYNKTRPFHHGRLVR
jgi:NTP pyrophosphatase (non-canonical NTP hydrolase)